MSSERFQRVKEIFKDALQRTSKERSAFLDEACGDDPELRAEVEELLATDSEGDGFLETPATTGLPPGLSAAAFEGSRIGRYLLKRVISSGGMGTVYEAVQEHPERIVAVKVMKQTMVSASALRRFEYEAQILARLRHPGIAQVIEAGTHGEESGTGLPYFVMEYIPEARSLTEYAGETNLALRKRIELFIQVCEAVHYGHQRGVIHRDLKPGNILVDAQGRVKIIDFGVARATDADITLTTMLTEAGQILGTLQYMSPEQCGEDPHDVDIRSDVYSLGVVLYELFCGELPYDVKDTAVFRAARVIQEEPPKRPSTVNRTLRGDAETILLKSLEKERKLRYQTAAELGADLQRYLRGEVILAKPAGVGTRFYKSVKRNPVLSAAIGVAIICLAAFFLYVMLYSYPRIQEEKAKLEQEVANTRLVNEFLEEMLSWVDPYAEGGEVKVSELLDRAAQRVDVKFPGRPEIEASIRYVLGTTYYNNGRYDAAERQMKRSLELYRRVHGDDHEETLSAMGNLAVIYEGQSRYKEAESLVMEALERKRRVLGEDHLSTLTTHTNLVRIYLEQRHFEEAENCCLEILERQKRVLGMDHEVTLITLGHMAGIYENQGRIEEAEKLYRDVIEGQRRTLGEDDPATFHTMNNLAGLYLRQRRFEEAESIYAKAVDGARRVLSDEHPITLTTLHNLASLYMKQFRFEEAGALFHEVIEKRRRIQGEDHLDTLNSLSSLAGLYKGQGRYAEAEPLCKKVLEKRRLFLGDDHPDTLMSANGLATIYYGMGRYDEAEPLYKETLEGRRRVLGDENPDTIQVMNNLGSLYLQQGRYDEAESLYLEALEIYLRILGDDHPRTINSLNNLAALYIHRKRYEEAEEYMKKSLERSRRVQGEDHPSTLCTMNNLAMVYYYQGRFEEAEALAREVVEKTPKDWREYASRKNVLDMIRKALDQ